MGRSVSHARVTWALGAAYALASGCIAFGEPLPQRLSESESDAGLPSVGLPDDPLPDTPEDIGEAEPHAVRSVEPNHGSFSGGSTVMVRGSGFSSDARVWFGDIAVSDGDIVPVDPRRIQVLVPAGVPGFTSVTVQNGDDASTRRTLETAYHYDAFYLEPASAPSSGGGLVTAYGMGTSWGLDTEVFIDLNPCEVVAVRTPEGAPQELDCRVPAGTPGSKAVRVVAGGESTDVLDAFLYADSVDGFRGGLGGAALSGRIRVIALNDFTGQPVGGAAVILGAGSSPAARLTADANGVAEAEWTAPDVTVTIAAPCFHPLTFVRVPVDTVTAYLDPVLTPECIPEGDPPTLGGSSGSSGATLRGEIVFPGAIEFKRAGWTTVPPVGQIEGERTAYVFTLSRRPTAEFRLPSRATAVTPEAGGQLGYEFELKGALGTVTLYAIAGIENRNIDPPLFTGYAMGLLSGVRADPGGTTEELFISMDNTLDRGLTLSVDGPEPTSRGPDRVQASVAVRVGRLGYAILPNASVEALLPTPGPLPVLGLPPLEDSLSEADYVVVAGAATGLGGEPPLSVIGLFSPTRTATTAVLNGFVEVPRLDEPAPGGIWNGRELIVSAAPGGPEAQLTLVDIHGPANVFRWSVVAPGDAGSIELPDPAVIPEIGLPSGPLTMDLRRARIEAFDYAGLGYRHLAPSGWDAYAMDSVSVVYP